MGGRPSSPGRVVGQWACVTVNSSQVKSTHKQQTTKRQPIECAPEASSGGREWTDLT